MKNVFLKNWKYLPKTAKNIFRLGILLWAVLLALMKFWTPANRVTAIICIIFLLVSDMDWAWNISIKKHTETKKRKPTFKEMSVSTVLTAIVLLSSSFVKTPLELVIFTVLWVWLLSCLIIPMLVKVVFNSKTFVSWQSALMTCALSFGLLFFYYYFNS